MHNSLHAKLDPILVFLLLDPTDFLTQVMPMLEGRLALLHGEFDRDNQMILGEELRKETWFPRSEKACILPLLVSSYNLMQPNHSKHQKVYIYL
jgi:hypothetical protein